MRTLLTFISAACLFAACSRSKVDTTIYTILPYDDEARMALSWQFPDARADKITGEVVDSIESLVDSAYTVYTKDSKKYPRLANSISDFRRQYIGLTDNAGEREVWIGFFCITSGHDWKHHLIYVDDGEGCFFQMRVNRTQRKLMELIPNLGSKR